MGETEADATAELAALVSEAAALHVVLEQARAQRDAASAAIDGAIGPYVALKNRISALTDEMVRSAASGLVPLPAAPVTSGRAEGTTMRVGPS